MYSNKYKNIWKVSRLDICKLLNYNIEKYTCKIKTNSRITFSKIKLQYSIFKWLYFFKNNIFSRNISIVSIVSTVVPSYKVEVTFITHFTQLHSFLGSLKTNLKILKINLQIIYLQNYSRVSWKIYMIGVQLHTYDMRRVF